MTKIVDQGPGAIELSEDELDSISAAGAKAPTPPAPKPDADKDYIKVGLPNVIVS